MFLSAKEIRELTGRLRRDAQAKALKAMGVEFRERPDGSLAVLQSHINKIFGGLDIHQTERRLEPKFGDINA